MLIKEIEAEKDKIYKAINDRKVYEAFKNIEVLLELGTSPELNSRFATQKTIYSYMIQYMLQGIEDPQRDKLYKELLTSLYEITDTLIDDIKINEASDYVYDKRRYYKAKGGVNLNNYILLLNEEQDKYQLLKEAAQDDDKLIASLKRIEELQEEIFGIVASLFTFTEEEEKAIKQLLNDKKFGVVTSSLVLSALTISVLNFYSEKKILTLFDAYFSTDNENVKQRALCGALILSYIYKERVDMSDVIKKRVELFSDDSNFCNDVRNQFLQFIRSLESEEISDMFTREIVPELIKLSSKMQNNITIDDLSEENLAMLVDQNPEWERRLEEKGISKKLRELNEMQNEGSDVMFSSFSNLKDFPFFKKISNWLRPYTNENSQVYPLIQRDSRFGEMLAGSMYMCSSDRYSLALTCLLNLQKQPNLKFDDVPLDSGLNDMQDEGRDISRGYAKVASIQYIQDLYRLFNLSKFKLRNIFEAHIDLFEVNTLKPIFDDDETLRLIGEFYIKKEYYLFAQKYFKLLIKRDVSDSVLYQKLGYCKQMLHDYQGAIDEYTKADQISEDLWTTHHLALCYKTIGNLTKAIEFYRDSLRIRPDSLAIEFQLGNCLMQKERYEEALKHFYKVDFIKEGSLKVWGAIGRCSLMLGKYEDAEKYYKKVLSVSSSPSDYINMGHTYLVQKRIKDACDYYKKSIALNVKNRAYFENAFTKDSKTLLKLGVPKNDIDIIRDVFTMKS